MDLCFDVDRLEIRHLLKDYHCPSSSLPKFQSNPESFMIPDFTKIERKPDLFEREDVERNRSSFVQELNSATHQSEIDYLLCRETNEKVEVEDRRIRLQARRDD